MRSGLVLAGVRETYLTDFRTSSLARLLKVCVDPSRANSSSV